MITSTLRLLHFLPTQICRWSARFLLLLLATPGTVGLVATAAGAGFDPGKLDMHLEGQLLRRAPHLSTEPIVRTGDVGRVELTIPDGGAFLGYQAGVFSFANNRGSFAINAATSGNTVTNTASLRWKRDFTKLPDNVPFTYTVNPSVLYLIAPNADPTNYFLASWKFSVKVSDIEFMSSERVLEGYARLSGPTAFGLTTNTGPIETLEWDPNTSLHEAKYTTSRYKGELDLHLMREGLPFTVEYEVSTRLINTLGGESLAQVYFGDPLKYGTGVQINYGGFGELFFLTQLTKDTNRGTIMLIPNEPGFYFILCRQIGLNGTEVPVTMSLGTAGELVDPNPPAVTGAVVLYTAKKVPVDQPLDSDGDGIHDVYELQHADILDPLDSFDASEDPDADGYDNLDEFTNGTDPRAYDTPPVSLSFPGIIVPTYPGGELIDLNDDGLLDSAGPFMAAALANPGGTFRAPTNSPVPGTRVISDAAFLKLDGDAFPDALVVDQLTNRLFVLRGVGDGGFASVTSYPAIGGPSQIVRCDLNGDALTDVALLSVNGRGADLHLNNGDGTLTRIATLTNNAFGTARGIALGDLNGDSRDDVVVGYAFNAVVFLSQQSGDYGLAQPYPVGSSPESIALGDLNHDGRIDIVAANRSSGDFSVLLATATGSFLPQVRYTIGALPLGLQLVDLNGDGHLDAVVSRVNTDYQTIFPGQGDGTFAAPYTVPTGDFLIAIRDWDGDGKLDLVSGADGALVNLGRGDGTFDTRLQIVPSNSPPTQVTAIDLNGDGKLELVGLQTQLNSIDVWEHAAVTGTNRLLASFVVGPWVTAYATGDFNGDGLVDLAVTTQTNSFNPRGSNQVVVLTNGGNFTFQDAGHYPMETQPTLITAGDFNGDGAQDLAVHIGGGTLNGGSRLVSLTGNGAGGFQVGTPVVVGTTVSSMTPANADADTRSELLLRGVRVANGLSIGFLEVFAVDATVGWTNRQVLAMTNAPGALQVVSFNGDAYPDLVLTETELLTGLRSLRIFPGGPSGFGAEQILENEIEFSAFSRLADLNGDGLLDVAAGSDLYLAKAGGGFHPAQRIYVGAGGIRDVADFNRDGKPDLLNGLNILLQK